MRWDEHFTLEKKLPLRVLSEEDWAHWKEWGYVIVRNAVPLDKVERLKTTLWNFVDLDPNNPDGWYGEAAECAHQMPELCGSGMVEIYQHQHMWDIRSEPRVYDAFVDVWDQEHLWVTLDRANLNPPNRLNRRFRSFIHWDINTAIDPMPFDVQGIVSLVDTNPEMGGTQAYPQMYKGFEEWVATQPDTRNPWRPDTTGFPEPTPLLCKAGDLLIFNSALAHGVRANTSENQVRLAQYVSMFPADEENAALVQQRIDSWRYKITPPKAAFPGDPREREKEQPVASLSEHGERLLGLRSWSGTTRHANTDLATMAGAGDA